MMHNSQADVISMAKFRARSDRAKWRRKYGRHQAAIEMGASEEGALRSVYESEIDEAEHMQIVNRLWRMICWLSFCLGVWISGSLLILYYFQ